MSKEILTLMVSGQMDLAGMAQELRITKEVLSSRIEMMVHTGFIEEINTGDKGEGCKICVMKDRCGDEVDGCMKAYKLTEKGRKVLGKTV